MIRTLIIALVALITFATTFPLPHARLPGWADRNNGLARRMYLIARDPLYPKGLYDLVERLDSFHFSPSPVLAQPTIHPAVTLTGKEALLPKELYHRATATSSTSSFLILRDEPTATSSTSSFLILRRDKPTPTASTTSGLILENYATAETTSTISALELKRDDDQLIRERATAVDTAEDAIATKATVANCNYQGYASEIMNSNYYLGAAHSATVLGCQSECWSMDACETYSFQSTNTTGLQNCHFYSGIFDNRNLFVISDPESPTYFSAKYPDDGSSYCYGDGVPNTATAAGKRSLPRLQSLAEWIWGRL
jgi:hypothetical protein